MSFNHRSQKVRTSLLTTLPTWHPILPVFHTTSTPSPSTYNTDLASSAERPLRKHNIWKPNEEQKHRKFPCPKDDCEWSFHIKSQLTRHLEEVHDIHPPPKLAPIPRAFSCSKHGCTRCFSDMKQLIAHLTYVHGEAAKIAYFATPKDKDGAQDAERSSMKGEKEQAHRARKDKIIREKGKLVFWCRNSGCMKMSKTGSVRNLHKEKWRKKRNG
ncbi:hypothetical protein BDZ45DRAFT_748491 [Acephala macrosclerotiorum]|nr:hypothetical protein BDZ45DRAFT_748491 [Acephala macrosclerotiorum]